MLECRMGLERDLTDGINDSKCVEAKALTIDDQSNYGEDLGPLWKNCGMKLAVALDSPMI